MSIVLCAPSHTMCVHVHWGIYMSFARILVFGNLLQSLQDPWLMREAAFCTQLNSGRHKSRKYLGYVEDKLEIVFASQNFAASLLIVYLPWLRGTGDCKVEHNDTCYFPSRCLHGALEKAQVTSSLKNSPKKRVGCLQLKRQASS